MSEQKSDLEKYFIEQEKRITQTIKEIENLRYKQILYELLMYLRFYYEKQTIIKNQNDVLKVEVIGGSEIEDYYRAQGYMYGYIEMVEYFKDKIPNEMYEFLGVDSVTSYNWGCSADLDGDFNDVTENYVKAIEKESENLTIPFYPNISVGWDNNVRFNNFVPGVIENNTPENFRIACEKIKNFADASLKKDVMKSPFITVNSWNEWTETSYLEPDDLYGFGYLEAIKEVFGEK